MIHLAWYVWAFIVALFAIPAIAMLLVKWAAWLLEKLLGIR